MRILALDLSMASTGWALGDVDSKGVAVGGTGSITPDKDVSEGAKFAQMDAMILEIVQSSACNKVIFAEFVHTPNVEAARASLGLRAVVLEMMHIYKIPCFPVSEISARSRLGVNLKKALTVPELEDYERRLKKNPAAKPKRDMKQRVKVLLEALGVKLGTTDDENDALVLLLAEGKGLVR